MTRILSTVVDQFAFLRDFGPRGLLQCARFSYIRHRWQLRAMERADAFDEEFRTETGRKLRTRRYGIPSRALHGAVMYWATPASQFREMIASLPMTPNVTTFVDLGCGKGRVLLLALQAGFREVVGVEISDILVTAARTNVGMGRRRLKTAAPCEVICADAASSSCRPRTASSTFSTRSTQRR
jgi:SAM-dependent methyltransferase